MDWEFEIGQARLEQIDGPAGIDRPNDAIFLELFDVFHAATIEHRIVAMRHERAIEIGAEQANLWRHREANLEFDRATAISHGWEGDQGDDQHDDQKMKSAYELAMERLEKKAPSIALTDEQKQQIAEIDSTFKARIAEKELFLKDQIGKALGAGNTEEAESLQKQLAIDIRRLQEDAEAKKDKLRATFSK